MTTPLFLCGYKGCGKTTIATLFAARYAAQFIDTDTLMLAAHGDHSTIASLYAHIGEQAFRQLEKNIIHQLGDLNNSIVATGGGTLLQPANVIEIKTRGKLIYLYTDTEILLQRLLTYKTIPSIITAQAVYQQSGDIAQALHAYVHSRDGLYITHADHIIDTTARSCTDIASLIYDYRGSHGE